MSSTELAIDIIKKQIFERIKLIQPEHAHKIWKADIENFCKLSLTSMKFEACCEAIYKTADECREYGFDRLFSAYQALMNADVAASIYTDALQDNNFKAKELIARYRMGWAETKRLEHSNPQDTIAKLLSSEDELTGIDDSKEVSD